MLHPAVAAAASAMAGTVSFQAALPPAPADARERNFLSRCVEIIDRSSVNPTPSSFRRWNDASRRGDAADEMVTTSGTGSRFGNPSDSGSI
jgi:hypothetical protein